MSVPHGELVEYGCSEDPQGKGKEESSLDQHHMLVKAFQERKLMARTFHRLAREGLLLHLRTAGLKTAFTENVCASGLTEAFAV